MMSASPVITAALASSSGSQNDHAGCRAVRRRRRERISLYSTPSGREPFAPYRSLR